MRNTTKQVPLLPRKRMAAQFGSFPRGLAPRSWRRKHSTRLACWFESLAIEQFTRRGGRPLQGRCAETILLGCSVCLARTEESLRSRGRARQHARRARYPVSNSSTGGQEQNRFR